MSFLYPLGLLGLIGVPILIIIYIIKNKYTEQTIPSTYIWNYSEKFLKRRKKLPKIAGLISLILQVLAVIAISLAIAHPVFTFPNSAYEYCFIIDASGSMSATEGNDSRFEVGKNKIAEMIENSMDGGVYTLICVDDSSTKVVFEREGKKKEAIQKLDEISVSYGTADMTDAIISAQGYFEQNPALKTFLITDKEYEKHDNVELINVSSSGNNAALFDAECRFKDGVLTATVNGASYGQTSELEVRLYIDGSETPVSSVSLPVAENTSRVFAFEESIPGYSSIRFELAKPDAQMLDNELTVYNVASENAYTTLLISDTPFFMQSMLEAVGSSAVTAISTDRYARLESGEDSSIAIEGYSLYIFDSYTPDKLPEDGSVWLLGQAKNIQGSGFSVQGEVTLDEAVILSLTDSTSSVTQKLTENMQGDRVYVYKYLKYGLYGSFTTLYSYNKQPLVFAGENAYGNRQVVFAFSLHDSNFPLLFDFTVFMKNVISYSFPGVIEKAGYDCGETLEINPPLNCTSIKIESPMGETDYPESAMVANQFILNEPGTYTVTLTVGDTQRRYRVFCEMNEAESNLSIAEREFSLQGAAGEGGQDGRYDDLIIVLIVLSVLILIDWGVYCYDKYQLR